MNTLRTIWDTLAGMLGWILLLAGSMAVVAVVGDVIEQARGVWM